MHAFLSPHHRASSVYFRAVNIDIQKCSKYRELSEEISGKKKIWDMYITSISPKGSGNITEEGVERL